MNQKKLIVFTALVLVFVFMFAGCNSAGAPKGSPKASATAGQSAAPETGATQAPEASKDATTATKEPAATDTEAPAATATPAAQQPASTCPAFKYYNEITIGMTKDEAEKALGLEPKEAKSDIDPEGAFNYYDAHGYGVYVIYNKDMKMYSKTVQYKDVANDLAPLTKAPVTEDQCDKITDGMQRTDVEKLLGGEGVECSATAVKQDTVTDIGPILRWGNRDGSFIQVVFLPDGTAHLAMFFD